MTTMKRYWLNQGGVQSGPYAREELEAMRLSPSDTYVWCSGMADWKLIDEVPELASLVEQPAASELQPGTASEAQEDAPAALQAQPVEDDEPQDVDQQPDSAVPPEHAEVQQQPPIYEEDAQPAQVAPPPYEPWQPSQGSCVAQPARGQAPLCPPTNLVWSIICTILCCTPLGVVAIIFAAMVKSKYRSGDYVKAQKYSDWSAWLCIASIVSGILLMPFAFIFMTLSH